jgi:hypothetical protein
MKHALVQGWMLSRVAILMMALLPLLGTLTPLPARATGHPENWCADAVDFAMRTAQYRGYGRTREYIAKSIEHDSDVFIQQYPDLKKADMQHIAGTVYKQGWTHFGAAAAISKSCKAKAEAQPPALLVADHSDEWCANAVDFAMGVAQNREMELTQVMISSSFDQNPTYYHMQFPELSKDDMLGITDAVYQRQWSRFHAAAAVSTSCKVNPNMQPTYPTGPAQTSQE